jgi:hypothetical protein
MNAYHGPPMTLGNAAAAHVRLIVWCLDCRHQVEPDPTEMAERYGAEMAVPDWRARLVCSECGSRRVDMVVSDREVLEVGLTVIRPSEAGSPRQGLGCPSPPVGKWQIREQGRTKSRSSPRPLPPRSSFRRRSALPRRRRGLPRITLNLCEKRARFSS